MDESTPARTASRKVRLRIAWEQAAPSYDDQYGHAFSSRREREAWDGVLRRLVPSQPPRRVLELGAGTGPTALLLAEAGHDVTALDLATQMTIQISARTADAGPPVSVVLGDAEALPFAEGSFDVVFSRYLVWTLLEPLRALHEWRRVTRPGGQVIAIDSLAPQPDLVRRLGGLAARGRTLVRRKAGAESGAPAWHYDADLMSQLPLNSPASPEPVRQVWVAAGLNDVGAVRLSRLDATLRRAMPITLRLTRDYHRYLVRGRV